MSPIIWVPDHICTNRTDWPEIVLPFVDKAKASTPWSPLPNNILHTEFPQKMLINLDSGWSLVSLTVKACTSPLLMKNVPLFT